MEDIVQHKLKIYNELKSKLAEFKGFLRAEEEAHNMTIAKGFNKKRWLALFIHLSYKYQIQTTIL